LICCKNNPKIQKISPPGQVKRGQTPGEYWQIDFSELPRCNQFKYKLLLVDTFSGWPEAFLCQTNKAREVIRVLLKEIIPRFGISEGMASDNRPHFVAKLCMKLLSLQFGWDLHTPWGLQSSGECRTDKSDFEETNFKIMPRNPNEMDRNSSYSTIKNQNYSQSQGFPFEILYCKPYPVNKLKRETDQMHVNGDQILTEYLLSLGPALSSLLGT